MARLVRGVVVLHQCGVGRRRFYHRVSGAWVEKCRRCAELFLHIGHSKRSRRSRQRKDGK